MAISNPTGSINANDLDGVLKILRSQAANLQSFQTQLNTSPAYSGIGSNGKSANGVPPGSLQARSLPSGGIAFSVADNSGSFGTEYPLVNAVGGTVIFQSGTAAPSVTTFPIAGTFAFYHRTSTGAYYFVYNDAGTLVNISLSTLGGSLSAAQHGNLAGAGTTMHDFPEISGSITASQHGAQTDQTLHADVTTTTDGFMTAADKVRLNTYANPAVAPADPISATALYLGGLEVLSGRISHIAHTTDTTDVATQFNALLDALQAKFLMA